MIDSSTDPKRKKELEKEEEKKNLYLKYHRVILDKITVIYHHPKNRNLDSKSQDDLHKENSKAKVTE